MILKLTAIIEHQSDQEKTWEQTMAQYGGRKRVLESPDLTMQVAAQIEGRTLKETTPAAGSGGKPADGKPGADAGKASTAKDPKSSAQVNMKDEPVFTRKELLELQMPLEKVLKESLPYYENKLAAQVEVIKNEINRSTQQILHRLEAGSHEKITHPDIRLVWKEMVSPGPSFTFVLCTVLIAQIYRDGDLQSRLANSSWACTTITWIASQRPLPKPPIS